MENQNPQMPAPSALGHAVSPGQTGVRKVMLNPQQGAAVSQGVNELMAQNAARVFPGEIMVGWQIRVLPNNAMGLELFLKRA